MLKRNGWPSALIIVAVLLSRPTTVWAHGGGGGHGGGGHGGGGFHGGGFHGGGFHGGGFGPGLGFGLGLGLGYGLGYGFGYGYPYGYGGYGYGGYPYWYGGYPYRYGYGYPYGYGGYGYGYPYSGYGGGYGYPSGYGGYGYGYPYGGYGGGFGSTSLSPNTYASSSSLNANVYVSKPAASVPSTSVPSSTFIARHPPKPPAAAPPKRPATASDFARKGDDAFKSGDYAAASKAWEHALVDDPKNGILALKVAQAMFAAGQFDEAAGAVQRGLAQLPATQWGSVVRDRAQLYGAKTGEYATQLQALEHAAENQPANPAEQFLLAYHYAFSRRSADATKLLDGVLKVAPEDRVARSLRDMLQPKFAPPSAEPPAKPARIAARDI